ncbi:hypothetical protein N7326_03435 [Corynebacterium sp. ES2794-CONJ1]|uniref:hypothetical protein n=1 Tax=Corynebacterium sp. ES2794-CONJ1 TaxID=2980553 RepID=UPI0021D81AAB|nr:hypothetical protein [Corynebacterium sp. ES2794-CONJ1]MCU9518929.1 hypothetical protein [Corynebacterium sp. ES2794-CONJ1]
MEMNAQLGAPGGGDVKSQHSSKSVHGRRSWLNRWFAISSTGFVIFLGLVIEYIVNYFVGPSEESTSRALPFAQQVIVPVPNILIWTFFVVITGALAIWLLVRLRRLDKNAGTLYYLYAQPGDRIATHEADIRKLTLRFNDFRSIIRKFSPPEQAPEHIKKDYLYNVRNTVESMYLELERSTNDDDETTSFYLAPDMIWPVAFRLGNLWFPRSDQLVFEEIGNDESITWKWCDLEEKPNKCRKSTDFCEILKNTDASAIPVEDADSDKSESSISSQSAEICRSNLITDYPNASSSMGRMLKIKLIIAMAGKVSPGPLGLTASGEWGDFEDYDLIRIVCPRSLNGTDNFGFMGAYLVDPRKGEVNTDDIRENIRRGAERNPSSAPEETTEDRFCNFTGLQLTEIVAASIAETLDEFPDAEVYLSARLPKTVALAAGLLITKIESKHPAVVTEPHPRPAPTHYWKRLHLMHFDQDSGNLYQITCHELDRLLEKRLEN